MAKNLETMWNYEYNSHHKLTQHKYKGLLDSGGNKLDKDKCEVNQKGKRNTLYKKFKYFLFPVVLWPCSTEERKANLLWEEWKTWILIFYQRTIGQVNTREAYYYNVIKENSSRLWYLYIFPATPIPTSRSSWHLFFRLSMHGPLRSTVTSLRWCPLW